MDKVDAEIAKLEAELRELRKREAQVGARLRILKQAQVILRGEGDIERKLSIPAAVEEILRVRGPSHINDLLVALLQEYGINAARETVTTSLSRYINQKRRFKRVGPNKFGLIEKK
jgi:hypothetical protein